MKFRRGMAREIPCTSAAAQNFATLGNPTRPLLLLSPTAVSKEGSWIPWSTGRMNYPALKEDFKVRYWNGKKWTVKYNKAKRYHTKEYAESVAFKLTLKEQSLIGELEVEEWVPCSTPKSRRPTNGSAPA